MRGLARNFDLYCNPIGQWLLNETTADTSGGGRPIEALTGTLRYAPVAPGLGGALLDGSSLVGRAGSDSAFVLAGDITMHCMVRVLVPPVGLWLFGMIGNSTSTASAENHQWAIRGSGSSPRWEYIHERGSGVAETYSPVEWGYARSLPQMLSVRRKGGVIQCFRDGVPSGPPSAALSPPTGGTACQILIGALQGASRIQGIVGPSQIHDFGMSDAQIAELFNRSLGPARGYIRDVADPPPLVPTLTVDSGFAPGAGPVASWGDFTAAVGAPTSDGTLVTFDGVDDGLTAPSVALTSSFSAFMRVQSPSPTYVGDAGVVGTGAGGMRLVTRGGDNEVWVYFTLSGVPTFITAIVVPSPASLNTIGVSFDASTFTMRTMVNTTVSSFVVGVAKPSGAGDVRLGWNDSTFGNLLVRRAGWNNVAMSEAEMLAVHAAWAA